VVRTGQNIRFVNEADISETTNYFWGDAIDASFP
jgi:hypothetical protein